MKKFLFILFLLITSLVVDAQELTKFLRIPVDGTKSAMIQKLKSKGYKYNNTINCLEGEFNGKEVEISVVTNNNKVYRIAIFDKYLCDEGEIKIRFNNLVNQFSNSDKYGSVYDNQTIAENEDISYNMLVKNKRYQAIFNQRLEYSVNFEDINSIDSALENLDNKSVWFMIAEHYGKYRILMFYDNGYNAPNGEDL